MNVTWSACVAKRQHNSVSIPEPAAAVHTAVGTGRVPVGTPIAVNNVTVDNTASFVINLGTLTIPAQANPLGNEATAANVMLTGTIRSVDSTCGTMTGMVTAPIDADLAGSTFATVRTQPGRTGNQLPAPVNACP